MCFEPDSSPPIPPISGAAVGHEDLVLQAADGNRFAAFAAAPGRTSSRRRHRSQGWVGLASRAAEMTAPILALQAGDDPNIPPEMNAAFDAALTAAGLEHEIVTYDGAPHSFFDRKQEQYQDASDDAWARTLAFIERYS